MASTSSETQTSANSTENVEIPNLNWRTVGTIDCVRQDNQPKQLDTISEVTVPQTSPSSSNQKSRVIHAPGKPKRCAHIRLITMFGLSGSGKTTVAEYLEHVYGYKVDNFAGPLKRGVKEFFGFTEEQMNGTKAQKEAVDPYWGISGREANQLIGTNIVRNILPSVILAHRRQKYANADIEDTIGNDFWVKRMRREWLKHYQAGNDLCAADGRFPNENEFTVNENGTRIRILRDGLVQMAHESEQHIMKMEMDYEVTNNGSYRNLFDQIDTILFTHPNKNFARREAYINKLDGTTPCVENRRSIMNRTLRAVQKIVSNPFVAYGLFVTGCATFGWQLGRLSRQHIEADIRREMLSQSAKI
jgi:hypothetical protein